MNCPSCGDENREGRRFCAQCGAALEATCASCGAANDPGAFDGDHEDVLAGLRDELGCDAADEHSFVVLSNAGYAPKAIVAQCTADPVAASRLLIH